VQDFNQAALDQHLQRLAGDLTPEQTEQFTQRVKDRALESDVLLTPDAIDGAADLLGIAARGGFNLPGLPSSERLTGLLDHLSLPDVSLGAFGDLAASLFGSAKDGFGGLLGGAMDLFGKSGEAVGGAASIASGAIDLAGSAGGALGDLAGSAGDLLGGSAEILGTTADVAGIILGALGDVLGDLDF
jgi:hypothetical protein